MNHAHITVDIDAKKNMRKIKARSALQMPDDTYTSAQPTAAPAPRGKGGVGSGDTTAAQELMNSLIRYKQIKFMVLCTLLLYVVIITALHYNTCEEDGHKRDKYEFIQTVLFGHTGVMVYVFTLVFLTVLLIIFRPFITKLWGSGQGAAQQERVRRVLRGMEYNPEIILDTAAPHRT